MQFLYFTNTADMPSELAYAFDRSPTKRQILGEGPSGKPGWIISAGDGAGVGYYKDKQTWRHIPGLDAWIGWYPNDPPTIDDLKRGKMLGGRSVELANGAWIAPTALGFVAEDGQARWPILLPRKIDMDDDGTFIYGDVVDAYRRLWEIGGAWHDHRVAMIQGDSEKLIDPQLAIRMASEVLGVNYRVSSVECIALGLFEGENYQDVLDAVTDWQRFLDWVEHESLADAKKNGDSRPATLNSTAGEADLIEATGQLTAT